MEEDAPSHILGELSVDAESPEHAAEAAKALEALINSNDAAIAVLSADAPYEIDEVTPGDGQSIMEAMLLLLLTSHHLSSSDAAGSILSLLEHLLVHGAALTNDALETAAGLAAVAMASAPVSLALHCKAYAFLNAAIGSIGVLEGALTGGLLPLLIADLGGACEPGRGRNGGLGTTSRSRKQRGDAGATGLSPEHLVILGMFLLATICEKHDALADAKTSGCIRAVLLAFARFPRSTAVYERFREVIEALRISDSEVAAAVLQVNICAAVLREQADQQAPDLERRALEAMRHLLGSDESGDASVAGLDKLADRSEEVSEGGTALKRRLESGGLAETSDLLLASLSLLEAISVSPWLACVALVEGAVSSLIHAMGALGAAETFVDSGESTEGLGRVALRARAAQSESRKAVNVSIRDEALARTSKCVSTLARVVTEAHGDPEDSSASAEELEALRATDAEDIIFSKHVGHVVCATLQGRGSVDMFAEASLRALQWLAFSFDGATQASRVESLVNGGVVEACSTVLRLHSGTGEAAAHVSEAAIDTLLRLAVTTKGALAVATRGAGRQLQRSLERLGPVPLQRADDLLLAAVGVLQECAD